MKLKKTLLIFLILLMLFYVSGYAVFRQTSIETWEKDGKEYVIFPENKFLFYFYRPLTYLDGSVTEMRFHIGQHT